MGDIKRRRKKYKHPKKPWDKNRMAEEDKVITAYGLKTKREIWKADAKISTIRRRAKALISASEDKKEAFFKTLNRMGFAVASVSDVLGLTINAWLDRRLQTFLVRKHMANNMKQARQLIAHKHVLVDGRVVNKPSFIVMTEFEEKISLKEQKKKPKAEENKGIAVEITEEAKPEAPSAESK